MLLGSRSSHQHGELQDKGLGHCPLQTQSRKSCSRTPAAAASSAGKSLAPCALSRDAPQGASWRLFVRSFVHGPLARPQRIAAVVASIRYYNTWK